MIYIGNFLHTTNQQEPDEENRRHGEFNLIINAPDQTAAVERFKERIQGFRESTQLFEGRCRIFLTQVIEFDEEPDAKAVMFNYKSIAGDPVMPFIGCSTPSEAANGCRIFDWREDNDPEIDGQDGTLFMTFDA